MTSKNSHTIVKSVKGQKSLHGQSVERGIFLGVLGLKKDGSYVLSISAKSLGGKLYRTFAFALYASHTRKDVIIDERKGVYVRG